MTMMGHSPGHPMLGLMLWWVCQVRALTEVGKYWGSVGMSAFMEIKAPESGQVDKGRGSMGVTPGLAD